MRREILCGRESFFAAIMAAVILILSPFTLKGQSLPDEIISMIEEISQEEGGEHEAEQLREKYLDLLRSPVDINSLSRDALEELGLLSVFQIESLLAYRGEFGKVLSSGELETVDGFTSANIKKLLPFITFGDSGVLGAPVVERRTTSTISTKARYKWGEEAPSLSGKYAFDSKNGIRSGLTLESDAGEPLTKYYLPDFTSLYVEYEPAPKRDRAHLKHILLGDFTAKFGQGLVLWKAFALSPFGAPAASIKKGNGIKGYTSTDESNFFRGVAASFEWSDFEASLFASANSVDARVVGDSAYTSIVTDGKHITDSEREKRDSMREYVFGGNVSCQRDRWHIGFSAVGYAYNKKNQRKVLPYNEHQIYDGLWGNIGVDFYTYYKNFRLFAEVAIDFKPAFAAIAGVLWSPSYNLEASLMLRSYSKGYIATHAGAYSTQSSCSNQTGATLAVKYIFLKNWILLLNSENCYYPHDRFRVAGSSYALKGRVALQREFSGGSSLLLQGSYNYKSEEGFSWKYRANLSLSLGLGWKLTTRAEGNPEGFALFQEASFRTTNKKFEVTARVTYYNTSGWDSRIYLYERSVPQSFGVETFYGKGIGGYLLLKYSPIRSIDLWVKGSKSYCAFFMRIFIPG